MCGYLPAAATACATVNSKVNDIGNTQSAQMDSAGSVWLAAGATGSLVQIIGTGAPAWPQLSYGHPGTMPQ